MASFESALERWKHLDDSEQLYRAIVVTIENALIQRASAQALNQDCRELRVQVESLIKAAESQ